MDKALMLVSALVMAGISTAASAAESNWFVRGEVGRSDNTFAVSYPNSLYSSISDNDTAWSLRGGYWFNRYFAVEGFYSQVYDSEFTRHFSGNISGVARFDFKFTAIGLGVVGKKNFGTDGNGFFVDARAGISRSKVEDVYDASSTKPYFGAGLGYDFTQNFGISLDFDRLKGSSRNYDYTASTWTLGAEYRF